MSENLKNEENFAELFAQYESKTLNNGDIVEGTVVEVAIMRSSLIMTALLSHQPFIPITSGWFLSPTR